MTAGCHDSRRNGHGGRENKRREKRIMALRAWAGDGHAGEPHALFCRGATRDHRRRGWRRRDPEFHEFVVQKPPTAMAARGPLTLLRTRVCTDAVAGPLSCLAFAPTSCQHCHIPIAATARGLFHGRVASSCSNYLNQRCEVPSFCPHSPFLLPAHLANTLPTWLPVLPTLASRPLSSTSPARYVAAAAALARSRAPYCTMAL